MKRFYAAFIFLFAFGLLNAQVGDWSPLPFGVKNVYWNQSTQEIIPIKLDSLSNSSYPENYKVWANWIKELHPNCDSLFQLDRMFENKYNLNNIPFHTVGADSVYRFYWGSENSEFIVLPKRLNFEATALNINGSILLFNSFQVDYVFGVLDSIALFQFINQNDTTVSASLKWSKNFGLIEFPVFGELQNLSSGASPEILKLVSSVDNQGLTSGLDLPVLSYFIKPIQPSDLYFYENYYSGIFNTPDDSRPSCTQFVLYSQGTQFFYEPNLLPKPASCFSGGYTWIDFDLNSDLDSLPLGFGFLNKYLYTQLTLKYDGVNFKLNYKYRFGDCGGTAIDAVWFEGDLIKDFGIVYDKFEGGNNGGNGYRKLKGAITQEGNFGSIPTNLGIDDDFITNVSVYPNPSNTGIFTLENQSGAQIRVYDYLGKLVLETSNSTIDLSNNPNGIYFLEIFSDKGVYTQKLVKN